MARRIETKEGEADVAVVKKYANRRLYNTRSSSYVTLEELSQMVRDGKDFVVYDAKSGEDITRSVLTQIILEEDSKGRNLLPISFLRQLIGFYDDSLHAVLPRYLEVTMESFARNQDQMRDYMRGTFGRFFPVPGAEGASAKPLEDLTRQNLALFQNAARMLNPFVAETADKSEAGDPGKNSAASADLSHELETLRAQMQRLQKRIERMDDDKG